MLITDIINYLKVSYEMNEAHFYAMGQMTSKVSQNKFIKEQLVNLKNITETFDYFVDVFASKFDTNNTYKWNETTLAWDATPIPSAE
jgi:hypothetical protein